MIVLSRTEATLCRTMGEEEKKPKIKGKKHSWKPRTAVRNRPKVLVKFKAPTPCHEDDIFTCGQASDAANFEEVCKKLARYCTVNFKSSGAMIRKAIEEMTSQDIPTSRSSSHCNKDARESMGDRL